MKRNNIESNQRWKKKEEEEEEEEKRKKYKSSERTCQESTCDVCSVAVATLRGKEMAPSISGLLGWLSCIFLFSLPSPFFFSLSCFLFCRFQTIHL